MKLPAWPRYYALRAASGISKAAAVLLAPIGFREVLLLGGATLLGLGASLIYPPAAYLAPGVVLVGVAVFGVRA
jgi:hypothetical protein